jgi:4-diphosphocytidyl-2-C-methyl-D-erythritol kinase
MQPIFEAAPAKVNLALHVTGQRSNGYHDLESLVVFAGISDELRATPANEDQLILKGPFGPSLTTGQSNLVLKAISAFRQEMPDAGGHGVQVELMKNLPVAAGIGGGSADAAAALRLMARLSKQPITPNRLAELAQNLGADVPVCLLSQACLVRGIGEVIAPFEHFPNCHLVLVNPLVPLSTADIFQRLKQRNNESMPPITTRIDRISMLGLWLEETRNDLQGAAFELAPVIGDIVDELHKAKGCACARMSGSGATVFGLFGSSAEAHQAAHDMRAKWPDFWVAAAPVIE